MKKYICELIGTFFLVFAGTGAIIANDIFNQSIGHVGISMSFGLVVMVVIYAIGNSSGAHINPAVTLGFFITKHINLKDTFFYIIAQCLGGIIASVFLYKIYPTHETLGMTIPAISKTGTFIYEYLLTFLLMLVILSVSIGAKEKNIMAGAVIGATVGLEALFAGPVTGASMNPARSLSPALLANNLTHLWIYILAPIFGALSAAPAYKYLNNYKS